MRQKDWIDGKYAAYENCIANHDARQTQDEGHERPPIDEGQFDAKSTAVAAIAEAAERPAGIVPETWQEFSSRATEHVPVLVAGLWAEGAFGFIGAPPKAGKTWVALDLAIAVATGGRFLGRFEIPKPRPVLYVALEGHRAALRARVGCLARGHGLDPDGPDLERLHFVYKPPGINLSDPGWARELVECAAGLACGLVAVDVLRAAARIKENDAESFAILRANLEPLAHAGTAAALAHHFGKLTETQKERQPGERMSGTGAMYGAADAAIYITGSNRDARELRLEFDARDLAAPGAFTVELAGDGTGPNGGFTYIDTARWHQLDQELAEDDLVAPPAEIVDFIDKHGGTATGPEIRGHFEISADTLTRRTGRLQELGVDVTGGRGKPYVFTLRTTLRNPNPPPAEGLFEADGFPPNQAKNGQPSADHPQGCVRTVDLAQPSHSDYPQPSAPPTGERAPHKRRHSPVPEPIDKDEP
jgi:hypothetical protein